MDHQDFFIFAFPKKRLNSAIILMNKMADVAPSRINLVTLVNQRSSLEYLHKNIAKRFEIIDVSDLYIEKKASVPSHTSEESQNEEESAKIEERSEIALQSIFREKFKQFSRSLSLGYVDKLLEQYFLFKILYISKGIQNYVNLKNIDHEKSRIFFFIEADRGVGFEFPILYIRSQFKNSTVVVIEFADSANENDLIKFATEKFRAPILNRYKRAHIFRYGAQAFDHRLYFKVYEQRALEILNIDSIFPWRVGLNKQVDYAFLRHQNSIDAIKQLGFNSTKLHHIGDLVADSIFTALKASVKQDNLTGIRVLVALPQYLETPREFSRKNYKKISGDIRQLVASIAEFAEQVTICLHPKQNLQDYKDLAMFPKVNISTRNFYDEILDHNLIISTESSVMKFAWIFEKPVIVYFPLYWKLRSIYSELNKSRPWTLEINQPKLPDRLIMLNFLEVAENYYGSTKYKNEVNREKVDGKMIERMLEILQVDFI